MLNLSTRTVREIALEMPATTRVFEEFKIDYCCGGGKMFLDACQVAGANPESVSLEIEHIIEMNEPKTFEWLRETTLSKLIGYILEKHHIYTKNEIANLTPLMAKVVRRHGENHPELFDLELVFSELCNDLSQHLLKEEDILFPHIERLERSLTDQSQIPMSCFGTVQNPIRMMMLEHDTAGDLLRKMREFSDNYQLPEGACPSYTALYHRLETFELDLHQHIHLENNLLFPRAVELEEKAVS